MNVIPYKREVLILVATTCVNRFDVVAVLDGEFKLIKDAFYLS